MPKMVFINLPVTSAARSAEFYEAIGGKRDPRFCNENTAMVKFSDEIAFMLLEHARFAEFTSKPIIDARTSVEALFCLSEESRDDVDATLNKAVAAGGTPDPIAPQDYGFMYGRSFEDPDGHIWEVIWMDLAAARAAMDKA